MLVPGNCKTAVSRSGDWTEPRLNAVYREMAEFHNCAIVPARVRAPKDKPNVEGTAAPLSDRFLRGSGFHFIGTPVSISLDSRFPVTGIRIHSVDMMIACAVHSSPHPRLLEWLCVTSDSSVSPPFHQQKEDKAADSCKSAAYQSKHYRNSLH